MARKAGQLISRGTRTWLVRVSLGRDPETGTRKYHTGTVHGSFREAQTYLNAKLQERDIGRLPRAAAIRLDDYLDQWLATSAKPDCVRKAIPTMKACYVSTSVHVWVSDRSVLSLNSTFRAFMLRCSTVGYRRKKSSIRMLYCNPHSARRYAGKC